MKDMLAHLEKLRTQTVECELIRDLATNASKRELFANLAEHYRLLASQVEKAIAREGQSESFLGRKTQEPFPRAHDEGVNFTLTHYPKSGQD